MADVIDYQIFGDDMQIVEVELDTGEGVRAEAGAMMYMEEGVSMQTSTGGGIFKGFKRMLTSESFFITNFTYQGVGKGHVAFGAPYPGKVVPIDLKDRRERRFRTPGARALPTLAPRPFRWRWRLHVLQTTHP